MVQNYQHSHCDVELTANNPGTYPNPIPDPTNRYVRVGMYPDTKYVYSGGQGQGETTPPIEDHVAAVCTFGNAYRHIDAGTKVLRVGGSVLVCVCVCVCVLVWRCVLIC